MGVWEDTQERMWACVAVEGQMGLCMACHLHYDPSSTPVLGTHNGSGILGIQGPGRTQKPGGSNEEAARLSKRVWFPSACWDLAWSPLLNVRVF